jgi:ABC-2 type transport system permease protein
VEPAGEDLDRQRLALSDRIRAKELHAFLEIGPGVLHPRADRDLSHIRYHARGAAVDEVRGWIQGVSNNRLRRLRLEEAGATGPEYEDVLDWIWIEAMGLVTADEATGEVRQARKVNEWQTLAAPLIMIVLIFIMIMMGAVPQLSAVMEEKTQRIAEVLFAAVRPFELMLGKLVGGVAVSFTASAVYVVLGTAALLYMGLTEYYDFWLLPWFLVYMVCAVLMMGSISAALGSACNDPKDAQNLGLPAMFPVMIPMFMIMPAILQPNSPVITGLSLFPLFTPILMLARQSNPVGIPAWQPWVGLAGMLLFTALIVWIGGRVFRVGMMMQGHKPGLRAIARWALRG